MARLSMPAAIGGDNCEEYGEAVVAPNGDVYTWKRALTTYSILKWTWVDDAKASEESCLDQDTRK